MIGLFKNDYSSLNDWKQKRLSTGQFQLATDDDDDKWMNSAKQQMNTTTTKRNMMSLSNKCGASVYLFTSASNSYFPSRSKK